MESIHFNEEGHLNKEGISWYVEYLLEQESGETSGVHRDEALKSKIVGHIQQCTQCHQQAIELYRILADIPSNVAEPEDSEPRSKLIPWRFALVLLLIPLAYFLWRQQMEQASKNTPAPTEEVPPLIPDSVPQRPVARLDTTKEEDPGKAPKPKEPAKSNHELYAANFEPVEALEALAGEMVRAGNLTVSRPKNGANFKGSDQIIFEWNAQETVPLTLVLLNNQEEILLQSTPNNALYVLNEPLDPGLYYWKLETPDELVYVGKFWVERQ